MIIRRQSDFWVVRYVPTRHCFRSNDQPTAAQTNFKKTCEASQVLGILHKFFDLEERDQKKLVKRKLILGISISFGIPRRALHPPVIAGNAGEMCENAREMCETRDLGVC